MDITTILNKHLQVIYDDPAKQQETYDKIMKRLEKYDIPEAPLHGPLDEKDVMLITYGNTIVKEGEKGLKVFADFMKECVGDAINNVHLLPMFTYTSDDGFSIVDYREVNPELGDWDNIKTLASDYGLMFDAVINHISRSSEWFQGYLRCEEPYKDYFITCDPTLDYSLVSRPRVSPLLTEVQTAEGPKHVWTTFSDDQIDLNYNSSDVMAEIVDLMVFYARSGARFIRLDAACYMWKELGTTCVNQKRNHELIKMIKDTLRIYAPGTKIITETNVSYEENIAYFGDGSDEADLVYQFALSPLAMYTMLKEDTTILSDWLEGQARPGEEAAFFNLVACHDGIGLNSVRTVLTSEQIDFLVESTLRNGGRISYKTNQDGSQSAYEMNISFQDAVAGPEEPDEVRIGRFLAAEVIMLSIQGMPGIYVHNLLGSRNDYYGMTTSNIARRINREQLDVDVLKEKLAGDNNRSYIFHEMIRMLNIRREIPAFSPKADQKVLHLDSRVFGLKRGSEKPVTVLVNVSGEKVQLHVPGLKGTDLLAKEAGTTVGEDIVLNPYQTCWIAE